MSAGVAIEELCDEVRSAQRVLPVGGGTKTGLSETSEAEIERLDLSRLSGILQYEPDELTLTALAGTPIAEIGAVLAEHGQYMPFDPLLASSGSTLGGTVASGISGPGAWRYGSLRDFVIGVKLIDGTGTLIKAGGKVVKNAAGFDLPKTMVGSMGTLGVLTEISIKVFPRAREMATLAFELPGLGKAIDAIARIGRGPIAAEAVELIPPGRLIVRLGADPRILPELGARMEELVGAERNPEFEAEEYWRGVSELTWPGPGRTLFRAAVSLSKVAALEQTLSGTGAESRYSNGGNVAWVSWDQTRPLAELDEGLSEAGIPAMTVIGPPGKRLIGARPGGAFADRVRAAIDPDSRFLEV